MGRPRHRQTSAHTDPSDSQASRKRCPKKQPEWGALKAYANAKADAKADVKVDAKANAKADLQKKCRGESRVQAVPSNNKKRKKLYGALRRLYVFVKCMYPFDDMFDFLLVPGFVS